MSKRTRWIIFCVTVILFFTLSYVTVVFALGYKYDFVQRQFVRLGSFRIIANTSVDVYVNGELAGNTPFLNNSFSMSRLLPRTYTVRVEKKGYPVWTKNISIYAGLFTDFPNVMVLPTELETESVASASIGFAMPEDTVRETKGKSLFFDDHKITVTWTENTDYQPYHVVGDSEMIALLSQKIDDVQWYKDRDHILVSSGGLLSFMEIDKRGGLNSFPIATITGPFYYDKDENAIYTREGKNLVKIKLG